MGWLRELMQSAATPIDGYGELSRRVLAHSEWPPDTQPQPRSLAALFSKLDRGIELEWLADRDGAQRALALTLGCSLDEVRRALQPVLEELGNGGRLRFEDLPYARPFDFRGEALPPGIPSAVTRPAAWGRLWWRAPSGSGRSLVGRWLSARGLAELVCARSWSEAAPRLPEHGPTFVELERPVGFDPLDPALAREGICVAAPFSPPPPDRAGRCWQLVESPALVDVLPALLRWIADRLPEDGAFDVAAAQRWLAAPLAAGELPTLGALLGVAGLLDARGVREATGLSLGQLAAAFVNERLEQASIKGSAEAQWLKRHGFDVLVKLAESALTQSDDPWSLARSQDEWIALVPQEFQQSVDTEWVRWSLSRTGGQTTVRDLDRALRDVPPGAYRIVRALVDARLLRERAPEGLVVAPEFLRNAALEHARARLIDEASPFSWGEALLRPHAAPAVLEALYTRLCSDDFGLIDGLLELDLQSQPALVVATEACLVCLGLRLLEGAEIPPEYLEGIWNEQLGCIVELVGELPRPRLLCFEAEPSCALARHGVWALAALAVSEALGAPKAASHALLRPWATERPAPELGALFDLIYGVVLRPELAKNAWAVEAFALAGRLFDHFRSDAALAEPLASHPLTRPARWVRALLDGDLGDVPLADVSLRPIEQQALEKECEVHRVTWPHMARDLWSSWQSQGCAASGDALFGPASSSRERLWPYLPREVLTLCWQRWSQEPAWPFHCFGLAQWSAFIELWARHWSAAPQCHVWLRAFQVMDAQWAELALRDAKLLSSTDAHGTALLSLLWQRFPAATLGVVGDCLSRGDATALTSLLRSARAEAGVELVRKLSEGLSRRATDRAVVEAARRWLSERIAARGPEWRSAYALFTELEQRLARVRKARGG